MSYLPVNNAFMTGSRRMLKCKLCKFMSADSKEFTEHQKTAHLNYKVKCFEDDMTEIVNQLSAYTPLSQSLSLASPSQSLSYTAPPSLSDRHTPLPTSLPDTSLGMTADDDLNEIFKQLYDNCTPTQLPTQAPAPPKRRRIWPLSTPPTVINYRDPSCSPSLHNGPLYSLLTGRWLSSEGPPQAPQDLAPLNPSNSYKLSGPLLFT
ncbi:hypothetical protein ACOMHN_067090 [Nucella lapillus]